MPQWCKRGRRAWCKDGAQKYYLSNYLRQRETLRKKPLATARFAFFDEIFMLEFNAFILGLYQTSSITTAAATAAATAAGPRRGRDIEASDRR